MNDDLESWAEWEKAQNDGYDRIPVTHRSATVLKVKVLEGFDIKRNTYSDLVISPNSHIKLEYAGAVGTKKFETSSKTRTAYPVWNESFRFVLPDTIDQEKEQVDHQLKFTLYVDDWHSARFPIRQASFDHTSVDTGQNVEEEISFGKNGKISVKIWKRKKAYLRFSLSLSEKELVFRRKRVPKVMTSLQKVLGRGGPKSLFETPVMSLLGSGGGIRATTAMCGVMEGLDEIGLLNCMTYAIGTSGSSWYLAGAYARQAFHGKARNDYHSMMRDALTTSCFWQLINPYNIAKGRKARNAKTKLDQPFTLVDYYGICVTNKIIGEEYAATKLSDIRNYVETADAPYPILNASQVQDRMDVRTYRADCNFSAYEFELPQYGINVDMKRLNSAFFSGVMEKALPEPDISFIIGTLGSIFGLGLTRILGLNKPEDEDVTEKKFESSSDETAEDSHLGKLWIFLKRLVKLPLFMDRNFFIERTGQVLNCARGLNDMNRFPINPSPGSYEATVDGFREEENILDLVDGGILCNVAVDAAMRPQRRNDILFVADFTFYDKDISFKTLKSAIRLAEEGNYKFPPIDLEKIKREETKEFYVFEDQNDAECPIVFWFLTCTKKFRQVQDYQPRDPDVLIELPFDGKFNDFEVLGSENYYTFNLTYSHLDFDRLRELMIYNVKINEKVIKEKIREKIAVKRKMNKNISPVLM